MVSADILEGEGAEVGEQSFVLAKSLVTPHLAVGDSDVMFRLVLVKSILYRVRVESGLNLFFGGGRHREIVGVAGLLVYLCLYPLPSNRPVSALRHPRLPLPVCYLLLH